jgi:succinoglycan biosynthesis transport protein ExoP
MDTIDRSDSSLPARFPGDSFRPPAPIPALARNSVTVLPPPQISPQLLLRGLSRHWWRILLLWLAVSTPVVYLILILVKPNFQAVSILQIEPAKPKLFSDNSSEGFDLKTVQPYIETQVQLIKSDRVLEPAIASSQIADLPMIKTSTDAKADLREDMVVEIVEKKTYLIKVALESEDPKEAADIVNAVVDSYLEQHSQYHQTANKLLRAQLDTEAKKLGAEITQKQSKLKELFGSGHVELDKPLATLNTKAAEKGADPAQPSFSSVTEELYAQAAGSLLETDMELLGAQAELGAAQLAKDQSLKTEREQEAEPADDEKEKDPVVAEFRKDPDAAAVAAQIKDTQDQLDRIKSVAVRSSDPARTAAEKQLKKLKDEWAELWNVKRDEIKARLAAEAPMGSTAWDEKVKELEVTVEKLKRKRQNQVSLIDKLKLNYRQKNSDTLNSTLLTQELASLEKMHESIVQKKKQLEFESNQEVYRVSLVDHARVPKTPSNNKQLKFLVAAPIGILFLALGLFLMLEIKAERVADPDALSFRTQSEVYPLPQLPTARSIRRRGPLEADDQIEQFIQRLDHVRFAVCGNSSELGKGRCVLITSAIGGEGKTTLAAQLAARCGNAGMSTLLIDADLRRTALCSLLDVAEGPGLSDVLLNDNPPPTELVVPVQGGTFHLLPAGTPVQDTSRALQDRKLGLLIAQFRQDYDLVIIDSPPVLPVPDALIIGRWVDGAVLAVRYDISRFPQVERARRQLDGARIAILGTVINGMRNSDSYYGRYSYSRRRSPQPDSSGVI